MVVVVQPLDSSWLGWPHPGQRPCAHVPDHVVDMHPMQGAWTRGPKAQRRYHVVTVERALPIRSSRRKSA